jgi:hypothetical protein
MTVNMDKRKEGPSSQLLYESDSDYVMRLEDELREAKREFEAARKRVGHLAAELRDMHQYYEAEARRPS